MTAQPAPRPGGEVFARPVHVSQRRYEAVRAYLHEGAGLGEAAARFGYTPSTLASLVRDFRAGRLVLVAEPGKPGRKGSPKTDRARGRVIELRREGLSVYEISARLALEGTGLNRTGVGQILAEEGSGRLLRGPQPEQSNSPGTAGRDTALPDALSSTVNLNVDLDIMLCVLAQALLAAFRARLGAGYATAAPTPSSDASPAPPEPSSPAPMPSPSASTGAPTHPSCARPASPPTPPSPWWGNRRLHFEFA